MRSIWDFPLLWVETGGLALITLKSALEKKNFKGGKWKGKLLRVAGKELLVKVVAQAIPLYTMYYYLLPQYFCDYLDQLIAFFWWNELGCSKKIHWMA